MNPIDARRTVVHAFLSAWLFLIIPGAVGAEAPTEADRAEVIAAAREIMTAVPFCALVTISESGHPNARMMDPFEPDEDMVVWLATNSSSRKATEIRADPRVTLYYAVPEGPGYVTVKGRARLVDDPGEKKSRWKERWAEFYEPDRSNYLLIEVRPLTIEVVSYKHGIVSETKTWIVPAVMFEAEDGAPKYE